MYVNQLRYIFFCTPMYQCHSRDKSVKWNHVTRISSPRYLELTNVGYIAERGLCQCITVILSWMSQTTDISNEC